jgi:hydrogenase maturation protease
MTRRRPGGHVVIIGIGNLLLRDDGVGVHTVTELQRRAAAGDITLPAGVELVDGGTTGRALLPLLHGARALVVIDAVELGLPPGSIHVLRGPGRDLDLWATAATALGDLLALARVAGTLPPAVSVVGIQPGVVEPGSELSHPVGVAVTAAIEFTLGELRRIESAVEAVA